MNRINSFFILLLMVFVAGCCGGGATDATKLIPSGADVLLDVNVEALLNDPNVTENIIDPVTKEKMTIEEAFEKSKKTTGFDFQKMKNINVFIDIPVDKIVAGDKTVAKDLVAGALISGTFDKKAILAAYEEKTGKKAEAVQIEGLDVYEAPDNKGQMSILNKNMVVLGSGQTVTKVIQLKNGKGEAIGDELTGILNSASADSYVRLAVVLPQKLKEMLLKKAPPQAKLLEKVENLMLCYTRISSDKYGLSLTAKTSDPEGAKEITTALEGLMAMGKMMAMKNPKLGKLMETLKIENSSDLVKINVEIDPELMKEAAKGIPIGR